MRAARVTPGALEASLATRREVRAAVVAPGRLIVAHHTGLDLAEAHRAQSRRRNSEVHQVALHSVGAALPESEIVLFAAALVAVTLDRDDTPLLVISDRLGVVPKRGLASDRIVKAS